MLELNLQRLTQLLRERLVGIPVLRGEGYAKQGAGQAGLGSFSGLLADQPGTESQRNNSGQAAKSHETASCEIQRPSRAICTTSWGHCYRAIGSLSVW